MGIKATPLKLLILEDNSDDAELAVRLIEKEGFTVEFSIVEREEHFRKALDSDPDLILSDYSLLSFSGSAAIKIKQEISPDVPLIVFSGTIGDETAVECMKLGAVDYVLKDKPGRLGAAVRRALNEAEVRREKALIERKLRESEERYRNTIENSYDGICIVQDDIIRFANSRAAVFLGYPSLYGLDRSFLDFVHPRDRKNVAEKYRRFVSGEEKAQKVEVVLISAEGEEVCAELSVNVTTYEGKKAALVFIREMSERKKAEEALRKSEVQKQALLDGSPDMIILLDTELKVLWANRTALDMCPDCVGQLCYKAYPGLEDPCANCPIMKAIETGENEIGIVHQQTVEGVKGESYWEDIGVPVKDDDGNVIEVIKIARNITDRVKRENELKRKNFELEKFNALAVGRELRMVDLKKEINSLLEELGRKPCFSFPEDSETEASL